MRRSLFVVALLSGLVAVIPTMSIAQPAAAAATFAYPPTKQDNVVDTQFGVPVADPYRWLENDVRTDAAVKTWVDEENVITDGFLKTLPLRDWFKQRMTALYDYERYGLPVKKGAHYFYQHNSGLQNQSVLFIRDSLTGEPRQLIDPNGWSKDGATALAEWTPSEDGKLLAYSVQDGGTDWRSVKVMDVTSGKVLQDELKWLKYSGSVAWAKDGSGFFYSRYPAPAAGKTFQNATLNHRVYFHKLGTKQAADRLIYATPDNSKLSHYAQVSDDGRWLVISTSEAGDENDVHVIDLRKQGLKPITLFTGLKNQWGYVGNDANRFFFATDKDAPLKRVVSLDVGRAGATPVTVVPEAKEALSDVEPHRRQADRQLSRRRQERGPRLRTEPARSCRRSTCRASAQSPAFTGRVRDPETFFSFASFNRPTTVYRYDTATGQATEWAEPKITSIPKRFPSSNGSISRRTGRECRCSSYGRRVRAVLRRRCFTAMAGSTSR